MFDIEFRETRWKILIADSNREAASALRSVVATFFIAADILEVGTGRECLKELASNSYDVAFMDLAFYGEPDCDALAAARSRGRRTFVTVMSAVCAPHHLSMAKALRAYDFISKPTRSDDVIRILDSYAQASQRRHLLLIDDSGMAHEMIRPAIERSPFNLEVIEAMDAVAGFEIFVRHRPEIVMIDLHRSAIDGHSACRIFRAHLPGSRLILVTGARESFAPGAVPHTLAKPFDDDDLDAVLHDAMGLGRSYFSGEDQQALRIAALAG